jgi:subtilase family serine protease
VNRKIIFSGLAAGALAVSALSAVLPSASAMPVHNNVSAQAPHARHAVHVCATHMRPGHAQCYAMAMTAANGKVTGSVRPLATGFTPTDVQSAYKLTGLSASGRTVAIVDAFGYPGLEADLATYRSTYGLPACTTANGCFKRMDQNGGSSNPPTDPGWDVEQALDVDAVSAACPDCHILVVQASSNSFANLETAVNRAALQAGVVAISNSYGCGCNLPDNSAYNHKGIAVTASTGDGGFDGGSFPSTDSKVVAVGGTSVTRDGSTRGYHETAWSGAGSGCGSNPKPRWQNSVGTTCSTKATADVSAAADPNLGGLIIYCGSVSGCGGFIQVGGTSESSPIIAAVYALSGNTLRYPAKFPYKRASQLFDVTSGSNGSCGVPVCTARVGWDGPTGMGTPNGVGGF